MFHVALVYAGLLAPWSATHPPRPGLKTYEALKAKAGKDSQAQVKLALWCEAHGLDAERLKHLAQAVLADPRNATARGLLGLVAFGGRWESPDKIGERVKADERRAARLAEYNGRRARLAEKERKLPRGRGRARRRGAAPRPPIAVRAQGQSRAGAGMPTSASGASRTA